MLKNKHKNKRCFIIGSGPSADNFDLSLLKDEITICVNRSFRVTQYHGFDPTYCCMGDVNNYRNYGADLYKELNSGIVFGKMFQDLYKTRPGFYDGKKYKKYEGDNVVCWLSCAGSEKVCDGYFTHDIDKKGAYQGSGTVVIGFALPFAMYLGCRDIYLIGCDTTNCSGYSIKIKDHGRKTNRLSLNTVLKSYEAVKKYTIEKNRRSSIYTVGKGGALDIFPRVLFENILNRQLINVENGETSQYRNFVLDYIQRYFDKNIIDLNILDVGSGHDPLTVDCDTFDLKEPYTKKIFTPYYVGNVMEIHSIVDKKYDILYNSHLIEDFNDTDIGSILLQFSKILKTNKSILVFLLPDQQRYLKCCQRNNTEPNAAHKISCFGLDYISDKVKKMGFHILEKKCFWEEDNPNDFGYNFFISMKFSMFSINQNAVRNRKIG